MKCLHRRTSRHLSRELVVGVTKKFETFLLSMRRGRKRPSYSEFPSAGSREVPLLPRLHEVGVRKAAPPAARELRKTPSGGQASARWRREGRRFREARRPEAKAH